MWDYRGAEAFQRILGAAFAVRQFLWTPGVVSSAIAMRLSVLNIEEAEMIAWDSKPLFAKIFSIALKRIR